MKVEEIKVAFSNNQKIEFALIDDLKNDLNTPFKNGTELEVLYNVELSNIKSKILKEYNSLISNSENAKKTYQSFSAKAKEIGIDVPSNMTTLLNELNIMVKEETSRLSKIKNI